MLTEGFIIMIIGMAIVFLFLAIVIAIMYCFKFFIKFLPVDNENTSSANTENQDLAIEEIAVAVAAIKKYMKK
jgi:sodium pump decarboxylase gamma subunit